MSLLKQHCNSFNHHFTFYFLFGVMGKVCSGVGNCEVLLQKKKGIRSLLPKLDHGFDSLRLDLFIPHSEGRWMLSSLDACLRVTLVAICCWSSRCSCSCRDAVEMHYLQSSRSAAANPCSMRHTISLVFSSGIIWHTWSNDTVQQDL